MGLPLIILPLAVPNIAPQFLVGGLCRKLGHCHIQEVRRLHHVSGGARNTCELVEACQLSCRVRSGTFATNLGVLAVRVGLIHISHAGLFAQLTTYVVDGVKKYNLCHIR